MMTRFWKLYAEGNAYVVIEEAAAAPSLLPWVTDPARGLGGDGLILVDWRADGGAGMQLFNRDGSVAPACGNGARCVAALAVYTGRIPAEGTVRVVSPELTIEHRMIDRTTWRLSQRLDLPTDTVVWEDEASAQVLLGTPHRVVFTSLADLDVTAVAPATERAWAGGTNVMFTQILGPDLIEVLPWERGVGRTLGCATGAAAAVVAASRRTGAESAQCTVRQPGGTIQVTWSGGTLTLEGSVRFIGEGTVHAG
jgi:diaminopimelate epimerase